MKTSYYIVNGFSWIDDTWLAPYCGWYVRLDHLKNKKIRLTIDGDVASHDVTNYPVTKLLTRTRKIHNIKAFRL